MTMTGTQDENSNPDANNNGSNNNRNNDISVSSRMNNGNDNNNSTTHTTTETVQEEATAEQQQQQQQQQQEQQRRRKRRWGQTSSENEGSSIGFMTSVDGNGGTDGKTSAVVGKSNDNKNASGIVPEGVLSAGGGRAGGSSSSSMASMRESVRARLAAAKVKRQKQLQLQRQPSSQVEMGVGASAVVTGMKRTAPDPTATSATTATSTATIEKRAKHFHLDLAVTAPTFRNNDSKRDNDENDADGSNNNNNDSKSGQNQLQQKQKKYHPAEVTSMNAMDRKNKKLRKSSSSRASVEELPPPPANFNPYLAHHYQQRQPESTEETTSNQSSKKKKKKRWGTVDDTVTSSNTDEQPVVTSAVVARVGVTNDEDEDTSALDPRLGSRAASKPRKRGKTLQFVEPGHWQNVARTMRQRAASAAAAGFLSGRKAGHTIQGAGLSSTGEGQDDDIDDEYGPGGGGVYDEDDLVMLRAAVARPRADANPDTQMPLCLEWWDMELLPKKFKKQVVIAESSAMQKQSQKALQQLDPQGREGVDAEHDKDDKDEEGAGLEKQGDDDKGEAQAAAGGGPDGSVYSLRADCFNHAALSYSKTATLVQHIVPVRPIHSQQHQQGKIGSGEQQHQQPKQAVLHLTKKELKRQRKLRRQEKQRETQDLQAAGLIPAPEPRLTLQNFIQVMGDQAFLDPSQMERKVQEQIEARQRAHNERNESKKLKPWERTAKRTKKLMIDSESATISGQISIALFYLLDASHPYHRTKMDLNAQQMKITGVVLECKNEPSSMACVICEGGPKAIQRYIRLMTVRMKWRGSEDDDDDDYNDVGGTKVMNDPALLNPRGDGDGDETAEQQQQLHKFNRDNMCELVWQGTTVKRIFNGFIFQACDTSDQARKLLKSKGIAHYWDQVLQQHTESIRQRGNISSCGGPLKLKLTTATTSTTTSTTITTRTKQNDIATTTMTTSAASNKEEEEDTAGADDDMVCE